MPVCKKIRPKHRKLCAGDLDHMVTIQDRDIVAPAGSSVDFTEQFTSAEEVWAAVETKSGETVFDSSNQEQTVTHRFYIRFLEGVTAESWVLMEGNRYDIITVEDLDERHEWLLLRTTLRGLSTKDVNAA